MTLADKDAKVEALKAVGMSDTEIADFLEFQANKERREKVKQAKEIASKLVAEDGKYGKAYGALSEKLDAIWEKALTEARKEVGLEEES